jgi:hypothetical protein
MHHRELFDHGIIIDFESSDSSLSIVRKLVPNWEIVQSPFKEFDALKLDRFVESVERNIKGPRIALTITEFFIGDPSLVEGQMIIPEISLINQEFDEPFIPEMPFHKQRKWGLVARTENVTNDGYYFAYPAAPCFLEGSKILCQVDGVEKDVPVEELKNGTLVKTRLNGYKAVVLIGKGSIQNPGNDERTENRLYKCSPSKYPELKDDLYITGCHSILESKITDKQKEYTIKHLGRVFITDKKYRLMACLDDRAEPWNSEGVYSIWHFALENADDGMNYGVYANGLLVETCSIRALKNRSNMTLF